MERRVAVALLLAALVVSSSFAVAAFLSSAGPVETRTARAWVDVASVPSGVVKLGDGWGEVETFSGVATGTLSQYRQVQLAQTSATESVVLDGEVWCMIKSNVTDAVLLRYSPTIRSSSWNISFECYAPQGTDFFDPSYGDQKVGLAARVVDRQGNALACVELSYGNPSQRYVMVRDCATGAVHQLADGLLPAFERRTADEGWAPDRYIVSFHHVEGEDCMVTVMHTSGVMIGQVSVPVPVSWSIASQLVLSTTSSITYRYGYDPAIPSSPMVYVGGWMVDNLACRGATAPYPLAGPSYEYSKEGGTAPARSGWASADGNATVTIDGHAARYNSTTGRYEADIPLNVQWGRPVLYTVELGGVQLRDRMYLTMSSQAPGISVAGWWNGWDWVSVFGLDDCVSASDVVSKYKDFDHPLTAYVMSPGFSNPPENVEIALHAPHDWEYGNRKFWAAATTQAKQGLEMLRDSYSYASRWDNPMMGGKGDTFISMANPGNKASYQLLYALYAEGVRIDGRGSEAGAAGNRTHLGSYYYPGGYQDTGAGWYPYTPMDLMDASRQLSFDFQRGWNATFSLVDAIARDHGVLRVYGHPGRSIQDGDVLHWIDDPKSNYGLENWKATDGEVASYLYGRWSTDIKLNQQISTATSWSYSIRTADPSSAGYWKVPITVAVDLHGRSVKDVIVQDGGRALKMSDGTLKDLASSRVMDRGFDVRNGTLYVSSIWNEWSSLTVIFDTVPLSAEDAEPSYLMMRAEDMTPA